MTHQIIKREPDVFDTPELFEHAQRVAKVFASSTLVPAHLKGKVADCLLAYRMARRLGEEPLVVMQNIYVVGGRPAWKTEYVIARARRAGVFRGPLTWRTSGEGEKLAVTACAVLADTGEPIEVTADMRMAIAEQWIRNTKYQSMPEHMLRWRSAAMLIRLYAPEVMLGLPVVEEIEHLPAEPKDVTPQASIAEALDQFAAEAEATAVLAETPAEEIPAPEAAGFEVVEESEEEPEPDPRAVAFEEGEEARRKGRALKSTPPEYRSDRELAAAWGDGWRAEDRRQAESDTDRDALRRGK